MITLYLPSQKTKTLSCPKGEHSYWASIILTRATNSLETVEVPSEKSTIRPFSEVGLKGDPKTVGLGPDLTCK